MYNIAILEDERDYQDILSEYVDKFLKERNLIYKLSVFDGSLKFLDAFNKGVFDLVFLDIEMPNYNGMDVAKKIREIDENVIIIFVTNMAQYAIKGYEVRAFDFIVKPLSYFNFEMKFSSAIKLIDKSSGIEIIISNKEGKIKLNSSEIIYVEVIQHMLVYHTTKENIKATGSLEKLKEILKNEPFSFCNRCYLVNLNFVRSIKQNTLELAGCDDELVISRTKKADFIHDFNVFVTGE